jgi:hypothetical protein
MHFAEIDGQVDALENFVPVDLGVQIPDFQKTHLYLVGLPGKIPPGANALVLFDSLRHA